MDVTIALLALLLVLHALWGVGLSLPEEAVLLLAAAIAALTGMLVPVIITCALGIAIADTFAYVRGRAHARTFTGFKTGKRFISGAGTLAILTSRALISVRAVVPFMAGALRMPRWRFHLASLVGALVSSALFVYVGSRVYLALPTAWAALSWMVLVALVAGVLSNTATKAQAHLLRETRTEN